MVAIITGSGKGIGRAVALQLARDGFDTVINDIDQKAAQETAEAIKGLGRKAAVDFSDVSQSSSAERLVTLACDQLGGLDLLINNAGITRDALLLKMTEKQWDEVQQVNLKGPFLLGQAAARVMSQKKSGNIINLASIAWLGNIGQTNYAASKAGVVAMTKTWALELARYGIRVNAIAPGLIETALTAAIPAEVKEKFIQRIPLKRMGLPDDIANAVSFLASPRSAYISGQVLHVDGALVTGVSGS